MLEAYVAAYPLRASLICFGIYVAATALSVPGAIVMTLAVGAVFGLIWGAVIVSFASSLGATLAFLLARYLLKEFVQSRYGHRLGAVNRGIKNDGPVYLLTLRLIPIVPYVAVNLLMGVDADLDAQFLFVQSAGDAAGNPGLRQRRHPNSAHSITGRHRLRAVDLVVHAARRVPLPGEISRSAHPAPTFPRTIPSAAAGRPQRHRHRRGLRPD